MFSQRLRQVRQARGLSLEALSACIGGAVTKQALSKYEQGKATPSPVVLTKLATALGVKAMFLWSEPAVQVRFIAYRRGSGLLKRDQASVESRVSEALEARVRLQDIIEPDWQADIPVQALRVGCMEDAESAAEKVRGRWNLGTDPICSMTGVLEDRRIHVLEIEASDRFDGISAVACEGERVRAAAVVARVGLPGERQRLDLAHELGHLLLGVSETVDEEDAAFRFGAAFLAPAATLRQEVGGSRSFIPLPELLLLKERFGMSMQALVRRFRDLGIVTDSYYKRWFVDISSHGWRKAEPNPLPAERPQWLQRATLRALAEGLLNKEQAEALLGKRVEAPQSLTHVERMAFLTLPLEERRRILAEQAKDMAAYYEAHPEWREWAGGDIVDYSQPVSQAR